jgi:hypothetical protein
MRHSLCAQAVPRLEGEEEPDRIGSPLAGRGEVLQFLRARVLQPSRSTAWLLDVGKESIVIMIISVKYGSAM